VITIFRDRKDIPRDKEYVELNDVFFNQNTAAKLDGRADRIIEEIDGDSGTGKTASFSFIRECAALNPDILCLNYLDYQKNIREIISQVERNSMSVPPTA
jgi:hypothetical protein